MPQLERHGIDASEPPGQPRRPEDLHVRAGGPVRARLIVPVNQDVVELATDPALRLVALSGARTLGELAERRQASEELAAVAAGEATTNEGRIEELVDITTTRESAVGVFIQVPTAATSNAR